MLALREADEELHVGETIMAFVERAEAPSATVTKLMPFGALARIAEGLDGLIHVSELSTEGVADPADVVTAGDGMRVRVAGIDQERRRLSLSIRQAGR